MIKSQKDFFSGLMFIVIGVAFALGAKNYSIGSGARMGPGYFPMLLGILLALIGAVVTVGAVVGKNAPPGGDKIGKWAIKPLFFIILANVLFGILIGGLPSIGLPPMGMIIGIYVLTIVASMAGDEFSLKSSLVLGTVLAAGSYVAFVWALKLQFPVWPTFITG